MGTDAIAERHGATMLIRLNRPQHRNSMAGTLLSDLIGLAEGAEFDDAIRTIVTTRVGETYSVGANFDELELTGTDDLVDVANSGVVGGETTMLAQSREQRQLDSVGIGRWVLRFWNIDKPTVSAINGGAAGGGFALALLHDFRIMSRTARITPGFARLGLGPEMGTGWLLPRIVGWQRAKDVLYRSATLDAAEALDIGLVDEVVEPEQLEDRALEYAAELAKQPSLGVRATKRMLNVAAELPFDRYLEREGLLSFDYSAPRRPKLPFSTYVTRSVDREPSNATRTSLRSLRRRKSSTAQTHNRRKQSISCGDCPRGWDWSIPWA